MSGRHAVPGTLREHRQRTITDMLMNTRGPDGWSEPIREQMDQARALVRLADVVERVRDEFQGGPKRVELDADDSHMRVGDVDRGGVVDSSEGFLRVGHAGFESGDGIANVHDSSSRSAGLTAGTVDPSEATVGDAATVYPLGTVAALPSTAVKP